MSRTRHRLPRENRHFDEVCRPTRDSHARPTLSTFPRTTWPASSKSRVRLFRSSRRRHPARTNRLLRRCAYVPRRLPSAEKWTRTAAAASRRIGNGLRLWTFLRISEECQVWLDVSTCVASVFLLIWSYSLAWRVKLWFWFWIKHPARTVSVWGYDAHPPVASCHTPRLVPARVGWTGWDDWS